jgi:hypothetical protein
MVRLIAHALAANGLVTIAACDRVEVSEFRNPDGKLVAKLLDDRGAGAATSAYQKVIIETAEPGTRTSVTVFEGEDTSGRSFGDLNLSWLNNGTLAIGFCDGTIDSVSQSALVAGRPVKVQLVPEKRGDWPASIPPERRWPEPPCV